MPLRGSSVRLARLGIASAVTLGGLTSCSFNSVAPLEPRDICQCLAIEPDISDYRHSAKHTPIPAIAPIETDLATILAWPTTPILPLDAPRTGRELEVFHVAKVYVQNASVNSGDCDIHLEISATPDKTDPRVVVETPVDATFCPARRTLQTQLQQHGFKLDVVNGGELPVALEAEVVGLAFEDFEHDRGSAQVATLWELHPARVTLH